MVGADPVPHVCTLDDRDTPPSTDPGVRQREILAGRPIHETLIGPAGLIAAGALAACGSSHGIGHSAPLRRGMRQINWPLAALYALVLVAAVASLAWIAFTPIR